MKPSEIWAVTSSSTVAPSRLSSGAAPSSSFFSASAMACSPPARSVSSASGTEGSGPSEVPRMMTGLMPVSPMNKGASHCPTEVPMRPITAELFSILSQ